MKLRNIIMASALTVGLGAVASTNYASAETATQYAAVSSYLQDKGILDLKDNPSDASKVYADFGAIDTAIKSNAQKIDDLSSDLGGGKT